jgi:AcrR family transcriptional regulator
MNISSWNTPLASQHRDPSTYTHADAQMTNTYPASTRRGRTRAALIRAAQELLTEIGDAATITAITDRADVAVGSFYNHFADKWELLDAAVAAAIDEVERDVLAAQEGIDDPAVRFTTGVRVFGRAVERNPLAARVLVTTNAWHRISDRGASPRALEDVQRCIDSGGFTCTDLQMTMLVLAGGANRVLSYRLLTPEAGTDVVDRSVAASLRLFGLTEEQADALAFAPLDLGEPPA